MRYLLIVLSLLLLPVTVTQADVAVGVAFSGPGVSIGINMPAYPRLVRVPGYPVFYDPYVRWNYFFYDGLYWVFYDDSWYASSWYNGPWYMVGIYDVPVFILRVPVRYYRQPPAFFHGWHRDEAPRWNEHWGHDWEQRRGDWNNWDRRAAPPPPPAPLPSYQRVFRGDRYPRAEERQQTIRTERYRYQPREPVTQQFYQRDRNRGQAPQGNERGSRDRDGGNRHDDRGQDRR